MARSSRPTGTKHWSSSEAKQVLDELASSGLGVTEFSRQRGLHPARLQRWAKRGRGDNRPHLPAFLPVRVTGGEPRAVASAPAVEVVVSNGWVVRVPAGCAGDDLRSVFAALREVAPC